MSEKRKKKKLKKYDFDVDIPSELDEEGKYYDAAYWGTVRIGRKTNHGALFGLKTRMVTLIIG